MNITSNKPIQINDMNQGLKNRIWNIFKKSCFSETSDYCERIKHDICENILDEFFKELTYKNPLFVKSHKIESKFLKLKWNEVYEFIEFVLIRLDAMTKSYKKRKTELHKLKTDLNRILEEENSGYCIVDNKVTERNIMHNRSLLRFPARHRVLGWMHHAVKVEFFNLLWQVLYPILQWIVYQISTILNGE